MAVTTGYELGPAAELMGITTRQLLNLIDTGQVPAIKIASGRGSVLVIDVDRLEARDWPALAGDHE